MFSCPPSDLIYISFISRQVHWRNSFPGDCQYCISKLCLVSLRWSEHTLWLHSCLSTGHRCVTRPELCLLFLNAIYMQSLRRAGDWLSRWSTVTAAGCGALAVTTDWFSSARPLSPHCQSCPGLWCEGRFVNESSFHQLSLWIAGGRQDMFTYWHETDRSESLGRDVIFYSFLFLSQKSREVGSKC